jgi:hypothetical protein
MSYAPIPRLGRRRLAVALALVGCATMPIAHAATASADSRTTTSTPTGCPLGDGTAAPGTIYTIPAEHDGLAAITVICGSDGLWHRVVRAVQPPSPPIAPVPVAPPTPGG